MTHQVAIWTKSGQPLCQKDWERAGCKSLKEYVLSLREEGIRSMKKQNVDPTQYDSLPLVSFGVLSENGEKQVLKSCKNISALPKKSIAGVLEFNQLEDAKEGKKEEEPSTETSEGGSKEDK